MNSTIKNKNNEHTDQSFNRVWNDYGKRIFYYMRQIIPSKSEYFEDYFQEIMLKVFKEMQSNNIKKSLTTWIYRITRNYCIDILRKSDIPEVPLETNQGCERYSPEKLYKKNIEKQAIENALEKLSAVDREIAFLRFYEDMKYKDIASIVKMNPGAVRERMSIIKQHLRHELRGSE